MKPLLIVKLGSTFPALARDRGDFEDWVRDRLGLPSERVQVASPPAGEDLPPPDSLAGAVLTGSHSMVTDNADWSRRTADWLRQAVAAGTPLLGICYGHQLLAHAMGGRVGPNPSGREFGTVEIRLHPAAAEDPLFAGLPPCLGGQTSHAQSALALPPAARCLAWSDQEPHHAFRLGDSAWGVQFHPEFDAHVARTYIRYCAAPLRAEGRQPQQLLQAVRETPASESLLRRFAGIACGKDRDARREIV